MALDKVTRLMAVKVGNTGGVTARYTDFIYEDGKLLSTTSRRTPVKVADDAGPETPEVQALGTGLIAAALQLRYENHIDEEDLDA